MRKPKFSSRSGAACVLASTLLLACADGRDAPDPVLSAQRADAGAAPITPRTRACGSSTSWPNPLPQAPGGLVATRVAGAQFGFIEGPVWIAERGVLLFSDMDFGGGDVLGPPARIRRLKPPAAFDVFVPASGSNGLALLPNGTVIAATHDTQSLSLFDLASGKRTDLTVRYQGKRFSSPNDLTVRSDGTVYFTDPDWQLGRRTREIPRTGVYRIAGPLTGGRALAATLVDDTLGKPNGIALSPDERTLYVGSAGSEIFRYDVLPDGAVQNKRVFAQTGPSDGMTVDCAGNLYVASGTVEVFAPSGQRLGEIRTAAEEPSNVAFGGPEGKTLYVTARTGLYAIALAVPGSPY